jgi:hypothetical protein
MDDGRWTMDDGRWTAVGKSQPFLTLRSFWLGFFSVGSDAIRDGALPKSGPKISTLAP